MPRTLRQKIRECLTCKLDIDRLANEDLSNPEMKNWLCSRHRKDLEEYLSANNTN